MLMVIFGAGASYDSVAAYPAGIPTGYEPIHAVGRTRHRMPLANQLFAPVPEYVDILNHYKRAAALFPLLTTLANKTGVGVEVALQELAADQESHPERRFQLAALRFYIRDVIRLSEAQWTANQEQILNHGALIDEITRGRRDVREEVLLVTFNYDTLIERGLALNGITLNGINDYVRSSPYKLIKLHGSTNWGRVVDIPHVLSVSDGAYHQSRILIEAADEWRPTGTFQKYREGIELSIAGDKLIPAIAVPTADKSDFECPKEHLDVLIERLPSVDRILAIGWRGEERHFLYQLRSHLDLEPRVFAVSGDGKQSEATITSLKHACSIGDTLALACGFSQFVGERMGKGLFNSR